MAKRRRTDNINTMAKRRTDNINTMAKRRRTKGQTLNA
jgi:hypothetical protein